jgi:hypothetical protein
MIDVYIVAYRLRHTISATFTIIHPESHAIQALAPF